MGDMAFNKPVALRNIKRIEEMTAEKGMLMRDIAAKLPMSDRWTSAYLKHMRESKPKRIYIEKWIPSCPEHEYPVAVFRAGSKKCAKKPIRTNTARTQRTRQRLYQDPLRHEAQLAKRRAKRIKPHAPDKVTAALFGMNRIVIRIF